MVGIDSETLFNGAAAVLATVAVLFFILNVDLGYSPVSTVALVVAFLAGIFAITQRTTDYQLTVLGYGVIVTAAVALFFDLVNAFDVGNEITVVGLLAVAGLLFALRTRLDDDGRFLTGREATYAFAVLVVLTATVLLVDVTTGGLAYELQHSSTVEYTESPREELRIGTVTASNPTPFPERVEAPRYAVCPGGNWSEYALPSDRGEPERTVHLDVHVDDGYNEHVLGYTSKTYPIRLYMNGANLAGETFPVRTTPDCPDEETGDPYIALFEVTEDRPYRYAL